MLVIDVARAPSPARQMGHWYPALGHGQDAHATDERTVARASRP
jgi:hypothetical protein